jgi:type I restriction enzyme, S subunit
MIHNLKPYPAYKDSGVPWLGDIPTHWEIIRSRRLFSVRKELSSPDDVQLSATQAYGVIPQAQFEELVGRRVVKISMHLEKRRHVEKNDFVISMRSFQGGLERAWASGAIRSSYIVLKPQANVDISFFEYLFKSYGYVRALQATADFIRDGQDLTYANFRMVDLPLLPLHEQRVSAAFLAHIDRCVNRFIRAKRRLIALLNEQKQAIIHRAVTRGLDPDVRLKPSGIEWLGEVPEHWEILQIGHFSKVGNGSTPSRGNPAYWSDGTYPWLNSASVNQGTITAADQFVTNLALRECHLPIVQPGSVLIAITGQGKTRGTAALLATEATINQHIAYISPRKVCVIPDYLRLYLVAAYSELRTISNASGSTKGALTCADIKHFKVAVPPIHEQDWLIVAIRQETANIESTIICVQREIDLIREYRTRLIADVVTGKLDVRGVDLADLDDLAALDEPLADELADSDDLADDADRAMVAEEEA